MDHDSELLLPQAPRMDATAMEGISPNNPERSLLPDLTEEKLPRGINPAPTQETLAIPGLEDCTSSDGGRVDSINQDAPNQDAPEAGKNVAISGRMATLYQPGQEGHALVDIAKPIPEAEINEEAGRICVSNDGAAVDRQGVSRQLSDGTASTYQSAHDHALIETSKSILEAKTDEEAEETCIGNDGAADHTTDRFPSFPMDSNPTLTSAMASNSATVSLDRNESQMHPSLPPASISEMTSATSHPPQKPTDLSVVDFSPNTSKSDLPDTENFEKADSIANPQTSTSEVPRSFTDSVAISQPNIEPSNPFANGLSPTNAKSELQDTEILETPILDATEAEFEEDSSPYESSSDDSSDTSDDDDDYVMLDAAEQARLLMEGDGGSDDEGVRKPSGDHQLRTINERPDEVVDLPKVLVTAETEIEDLGHVETTVENVILISAKTSGEYRVLESGSVLCLDDRTVIGVVSETIGRVEQPFYSVRFPNSSAIAETGITKDTRIYYIPQYSTFVFTKALQKVKGSDASNLHDEEVAAHEQEFSDDEAEMEFRRAKKEKRQSRPPGNSADAAFSRRPREGHSGHQRTTSTAVTNNDVTHLQYDDDGGEELYTPLSRPQSLYHSIIGAAPGTTPGPDEAERSFSRQNSNSSGRGHRGSYGQGSERGRPPRGRGNTSHRGQETRRESTMTRPNISRATTSSSTNPDLPSPSFYGSSSSASPSTAVSAPASGFGGFPAPSPQTPSFQQQRFGQMHTPHSTLSYPTLPATPMGFHAPYYAAHQPGYHYPQQPFAPQQYAPPQYAPQQQQQHPPHPPPQQYPAQQQCPPQLQYSPPQHYLSRQGYAPPPPHVYGSTALPAGAFVNPAFWNGGQRGYAAPSASNPDYTCPPNQASLVYQAQAPAQTHSQVQSQAQAQVQAQAQGTAFQAAQEKLDVLKRP